MHPSNQVDVNLGQGTSGMEVLEDHRDLEVTMTTVGCGGLIKNCQECFQVV